jgi:AcrR family transcriptional regulator
MPSGRTRQFDTDQALARALEVFRARGYEGAALPELTAAMGINRPSLYAAFGKCAVLARYIVTVLNGMAVQAVSGATQKELRLISAVAMRAWPA